MLLDRVLSLSLLLSAYISVMTFYSIINLIQHQPNYVNSSLIWMFLKKQGTEEEKWFELKLIVPNMDASPSELKYWLQLGLLANEYLF